jgi:hypothetical protein
MSIFETHVKDVAQRTDSDPLSLNVGFQVVDDSEQLDEGEVDARPGHVVAVDTGAEGTAEKVTVNMPEVTVSNTRVTVKVLDSTNAVDIKGLNDTETLDIASGNDGVSFTALADGDTYHIVESHDGTVSYA